MAHVKITNSKENLERAKDALHHLEEAADALVDLATAKGVHPKTKQRRNGERDLVNSAWRQLRRDYPELEV